MTTHVLTMRDGAEYRLTESQAKAVMSAIDRTKNFYLRDDYLSCHEVRSIKRVQSALEGEALRLDSPVEEGMSHASPKRQEALERIRKTLAYVDSYQANCNAYKAAVDEKRHREAMLGSQTEYGYGSLLPDRRVQTRTLPHGQEH